MSSIYYSAVWTHQACKILARKRLPRGRRKTYLTYKHGLYPQVKSLLAFFPDKNKGWSQKSLFQRAREVKADVTYQELYWIFCAHKHTLPMAASGLTITRPSGRPDVTIGPHIKGVYRVSTFRSFPEALQRFSAHTWQGTPSQNPEVLGRLQRSARSVAAVHPDICN
jgi:hypothetical protein